ncbi:uncharacterized protein LOC143017632 [Oratosquilla oratoria]|uniref:uncharacterized protein LOC143017632 n=1 Tax=Oratosquilla oratoria TaxID=337810 RepID=UPI003F76A64A
MKAIVFGLFVVIAVRAAPQSVATVGEPSPSNAFPQGPAPQPFFMNQLPLLQQPQLTGRPHVVPQFLPTFPFVQTVLVPQLTPAQENALAHQAFFQMWHAQAARNSVAPTLHVPAEASAAAPSPDASGSASSVASEPALADAPAAS